VPLGDVEEAVRFDQLAAVAHAHQQLAGGDVAGREVEDRLCVQDELVVVQGLPDPVTWALKSGLRPRRSLRLIP
jgi:hypothetical protein